MCSTCGCSGTGEVLMKAVRPSSIRLTKWSPVLENHQLGHTATEGNKTLIQVEKDILHVNNNAAEKNRALLKRQGILALNLVSSPGSGKTSILERTLQDMKDKRSFYVIEGDQQTTQDADRIAATNTPVLQINTGKGCHLDAVMVSQAIQSLHPDPRSILMIENVGNLVCPAGFDLGESKRVVIISVTEGEDKPLKYPDIFESSDLCLINKIDLLPYLRFDVEKLKQAASQVNPLLRFILVSATEGTGMQEWYSWIEDQCHIPAVS